MLPERLIPFIRPVPQWTAVAIAPPQRSVTVHLSWEGGSRDVTDDHAVASLRPLTIATGTDAGAAATLDYREDGRSLGSLRLVKSGTLSSLSLYRVEAGGHRCLPWPWRAWNGRLHSRAARRSKGDHNFRMDPAALQHLMVCYIDPRPVVLVSVSGPGHFNIFPMDLIGSVGGHFTLALRSTNISIPLLREGARVALSCLPAGMKAAAYDLGRHHKAPLEDPASLPFATRPSSGLGVPAVGAALRLRELAIRQAEEIGSHIFFVADILSDERIADGKQLHHVSGIYQAFRRRRGAALPEA